MDEMWLKYNFLLLKSVKVNSFPDQRFSWHLSEGKSWPGKKLTFDTYATYNIPLFVYVLEQLFFCDV